MKYLIILLAIIAFSIIANAQSDKEGCKEHPFIPNRISGYFIGECENNEFSVHTVPTKTGEKTLEGKKNSIAIFPKSRFERCKRNIR